MATYENNTLMSYKDANGDLQILYPITKAENVDGLSAEAVGARPDTWTPTASDVGARPDTWTPTASDVGAVAQFGSTLTTSILEEAINATVGVYHYRLSGSSYSGGDLPHTNYAYGSATVYKRTTGVIDVTLYGTGANYPRQTNHYNGTTWSGWTTEFLPLTGGPLNGDLILKKANNGYGEIMKNHSNTADYGTGIGDYDSSGKSVSLSIRASEEKVYFNTSAYAFEIYGEHNKPSGSYTGNGSATERKIATGGIGNCAVITSGEGTALITRRGVFVGDISTHSYIKNDNVISDGTMWLKTTHNTLNKSGVVYTYQVL